MKGLGVGNLGFSPLFNPDEIKKRYRIKNLLEQQEDVLRHLLTSEGKKNILYMAPAARGKTLPPLIATLENRRQRPKKMTLWFVPTIALAQDLQKRINRNGNYVKIVRRHLDRVKCMCFTGESIEDKRGKKVSIGNNGNPDLLIVSPENLKDPSFLAWLISSGTKELGLIVLDEAHLFDEWGITFRRSYFIISWLIRTLRDNDNSLRVIALSASLPEDKEIVVRRLLSFEEDDTFSSKPTSLVAGPKIICHSKKGKSEKRNLLIKILRKNLKDKGNGDRPKGVLFSPYKRLGIGRGMHEWSVENIEETVMPKLNLKSNEWRIYTGDTSSEERAEILNDLHKKKGKIRLLLATSAFGFGVDVDKLNFSIHVQVPEDLDRFYQEISRCSRRPGYGRAYLFYNSHEVAVQTKRCMGTFRYETIKEYLNLLGVKKITKGKKTLSLRGVLRKSDKTFTNERRAQMSADLYFSHAFEAIMFLYRHSIIDLRPLREKNFSKSLNALARAFLNGRNSGYRRIPYKGFKVFLPSVKFPINIKKNVSWPEIERLVETDKMERGQRTQIFRKMGRGGACYWGLIARHYNVGLQNKGQKPMNCCDHRRCAFN